MNEKMLNVPLDNETRNWLDAEAQANGRSVSREAAQIIKAAKCCQASHKKETENE